MAKVCFKNFLEESADYKEIERDKLLSAVYEYAKTCDDELYDLILHQKVSIRVNGEIIHPDDWMIIDLTPDSEVEIIPALGGGGKAAGMIMMVIGVALIAVGQYYAAPLMAAQFGAFTAYQAITMIGVSLALGGLSSLLFAPDLPQLGLGNDRNSQTYSWSGIRTTAQYDSCVPIVYGTHKVGGNLISAFTENYQEDSYLYMLISLCEGEIAGIVRESDHTEVCLTSNPGDASYTYYPPAIEVDGQPLKNYNNVVWWYRTGTVTENASYDQYYPFVQNKIPGFDGARIQVEDGRELSTAGVIYTTTKEVDEVTVRVKAPQLYDTDNKGKIEAQTVTYKIEFAPASSGSYTLYEPPVWKPDVTVITSVSDTTAENLICERYLDNDRVYGDTSKTKSFRVRILGNTFVEFDDGGFDFGTTITYTITYEVTTVNNDDLTAGEYAGIFKASSWAYRDLGGGTPAQYNEPIVSIGDYSVKLDKDCQVGEEWQLSSVEDTDVSRTGWIPLKAKTTSGHWSAVTLDFNNVSGGNGRGMYDIRISRRTEVSSDFSKQDKLYLDSVIETVEGEFIYPHTALLGLKIKATGQLSGSVPNITTTIKGTKIKVPDTSGSETFDQLYYDENQSRFETSGGLERTWNGTTYQTAKEFSNNAMLCVRDLVLSSRYGLGSYITTTDLNQTDIAAAIKKCHIVYDPYADASMDYFDWWSETSDSNWYKQWYGLPFYGNLEPATSGVIAGSASTRDIVCSGATYYAFYFAASTGLYMNMPYTVTVTLKNCNSSALNLYIYGFDFYDGLEDLRYITSTTSIGDGTHTLTFTPKVSYNFLCVGVGGIEGAQVTIDDISLIASITDRYHTYDGVLDASQSAMTALFEFCDSFRCWPIWKNGQFAFVIDQDDTPEHSLSMGNIVEGSYNQTFTALSEIPSRLVGQFTDRTLGYDLRSAVVRVTQSHLREINERTIGLKGIVSKEKAERELIWKLNKVINCNKIISLRAALDAIHVTAGDIINIEHTLPNWGSGGRIVSIGGTTVVLDTPYTFSDPAGQTYILRYQTNDNSFLEAEIDTSTYSPGDEKIQITVLAWESSTAPKQDAAYQIGIENFAYYPFRIISANRTEEHEVEITAVEHLSALYTESDIKIITPNPNPQPPVPTPTGKPKPPVNVSVTGIVTESGLGFIFKAEPNSADAGRVQYILVQMSSSNDGLYNTITSIPVGLGEIRYIGQDLLLDNTYYFRFICVTYSGVKSDPYSMSYTLDRTALYGQLPIPTGVRISDSNPNDQYFEGRDCRIEWNEVGIGSGSSVKGYKVLIYHDTYAPENLLRESFCSSPPYIYTYEANKLDSKRDYPYSTLVIIVKTVGTNGSISRPSTPLLVSNDTPRKPTNLTITPVAGGINFRWDANLEGDFSHYRGRIRITGEGNNSDWSVWVDYGQTTYTYTVDSANRATYGPEQIVYVELKSVDLYRNESAVTSGTGTTEAVTVDITEVDDFSITASKLWVNIPILESDSWTNNSPSAGYVAWNTHYLYHNGIKYTIAAGSTNLKYIYWAGLGSSYSSSNTHPVLADNEFIIATNVSGAHDLAWNSIANQVIGSAFIQDAAIIEAKIGDLSVTNAKIAELAVTNLNVAEGTLTASKIAGNSFGNLIITSGTITIQASSYILIDTSTGGAGLLIGDTYSTTGWSINEIGLLSYTGGDQLHAFALSTFTWQTQTLNNGDFILGKYVSGSGIFWDNDGGADGSGQLDIKGNLNLNYLYAPPDDINLILYLSCDEGEGNVVADSTPPLKKSGITYSGTWVGTHYWTSGIVGSSIRTSSGNYVTLGSASELRFTSTFSFTCWIRPQSVETAFSRIFSNTSVATSGYALLQNSNNTVYVAHGTASGTKTCLGTSIPLTSQTWYFVAYRYDASTSKGQLYINCELAGQNTSLIPPAAALGNFTIGADPSGSNAYTGRVDELRIYKNLFITDQQMRALYMYPSGLKGGQVVAHSVIIGDIPEVTGWIIDKTGLVSYSSSLEVHAFALSTKSWQGGTLGTGDAVIGRYIAGEGGIWYDHSEGQCFIRGNLSVESFAAIPSDSIQYLYISFDENSGARCLDGSQSKYDFVDCSSAPLSRDANGIVGYWLNCGGSGGVKSENEASVNLNITTQNFMFSFWINTTALDEDYIISRGRYETSLAYGWGIYYSGVTKKLTFYGNKGGGATPAIYTSTTALSNSTNYHCCFVRNGTSWAWYINGVEAGSGTNFINLLSNTNVQTIIGARNNAGASAFLGKIDEMRIYKDATYQFSDANVKSLYTNPSGNKGGVTISGSLIVGDLATSTGFLIDKTGFWTYLTVGADLFTLHAFSLSISSIYWQVNTNTVATPINPSFVLDIGDIVLGGYNYKVPSTTILYGGIFWDQSEKILTIRGDLVTGSNVPVGEDLIIYGDLKCYNGNDVFFYDGAPGNQVAGVGSGYLPGWTDQGLVLATGNNTYPIFLVPGAGSGGLVVIDCGYSATNATYTSIISPSGNANGTYGAFIGSPSFQFGGLYVKRGLYTRIGTSSDKFLLRTYTTGNVYIDTYRCYIEEGNGT